MYQVEYHSFNEGGHFHFQKFFDNNDVGKKLVSYVNEVIDDYVHAGYRKDDFYITTRNGSPCVVQTLLKDSEYTTCAVEIIIRELQTDIEYEYEC